MCWAANNARSCSSFRWKGLVASVAAPENPAIAQWPIGVAEAARRLTNLSGRYLPPRLPSGVRRHCLEADRLPVCQWSYAGMAEDEEPEFSAAVTYPGWPG
jgi:hypothetical protein